MPDRDNLISLLRTLRFLAVELGETPPPCLADAIENVEPYTLAEILRQRRLAMWGLPSPRGWLRLLAQKLGVRLKHLYPELRTSDLFLWIRDEIDRQRIANRALSDLILHF
jgi:hypothetical protein